MLLKYNIKYRNIEIFCFISSVLFFFIKICWKCFSFLVIVASVAIFSSHVIAESSIILGQYYAI